MSEQGQFDLCPKCGAIARDGVCQSCGYEISGVKETLTRQNEMQAEQQNEQQIETNEQQIEMKTDNQEIIQSVENAESIDNSVYSSSEVYQSQSSQDIYQTPDTNSEIGTEPSSVGGIFSGEQQVDNQNNANNAYYGNSYVGNQNNTYSSNNSYNNAYNNNPYAANQNNANPYNNAYGNAQYNGNNQYAGNNQYSGNNQYNGNAQYTGNNSYGNGQYGNNNAYGNMNGYNQYGANPNPYSPYAAPQQKKHTGLIIGVIIGAVVLFFIALFALVYHAVDSYSEKKEVSHQLYNENDRDDFDFDYDDYDYDDEDDDYDYDDDDDYFDFDDYDERYYSLHDDIKYDLSYSIEWEYYEYETDLENVSISVDYPVIVGDDVPNLDKLNEKIAEEAEFFTEYFEEEYIDYLDEEEGYFSVYAAGYVTYMDEDILSIVFSEDIYTDYFGSVSLYCINIDMENGVILDNNDLLDVDDDFSVDFRVRSEKQNGTVEGLDEMSDQEITEYLSSSNLIVFYIPQGMEIGLNYEDGWVTVTYQDYQDYLKIF